MLNSLPLFVGLRYVRARSHKFFVSFITWVSLLCVCLGVMALIVILSVMNGLEGELRDRLRENTRFFRERMSALGYRIAPGDHPIVPVMLGDAKLAGQLADWLLMRGVYVIGFSYPVVPQGKARIRTQISAAHTRADLEFALEQFGAARGEFRIAG